MLKRAKHRAEKETPDRNDDAHENSVDDTGFSITRYDMLAAAQDFNETMRGLQTRELRSPDIFWRFFGSGARV
jgi:hypothetical protein